MVYKEKRRDEARVGVVGRNNITFSHSGEGAEHSGAGRADVRGVLGEKRSGVDGGRRE